MPSAPSVGVVIASHNNASFVGRAIRSVAGQSFRKIDVAIVDDASTDESDSEIRHCLAELDDPQFRYVRLEPSEDRLTKFLHEVALKAASRPSASALGRLAYRLLGRWPLARE